MGFIENEIMAEIEDWEQSQDDLRTARAAAYVAQITYTCEVIREYKLDREVREFDDFLMSRMGEYGTKDYW